MTLGPGSQCEVGEYYHWFLKIKQGDGKENVSNKEYCLSDTIFFIGYCF